MGSSKAQNVVKTRSNPKRVPVLTVSRTFGQKSPIVNEDLQTFLALCMSSWNDYSEEEKKDIMQSLPAFRRPNPRRHGSSASHDQSPNNLHTNHDSLEMTDTTEKAQEGDDSPLSPDFLASDTYIKRAIARFKRDVSDGYYEKAWQDKAKQAQADRRHGKFDEFLQRCTDEMFMPEDGEDDELGGDGDESDEDLTLNGRNGHKRQRTKEF